MNKTKEQLIIENEELNSRLVEIESTLLAIGNGEVDAIMVSGTKGEQVYSLSTAETPYRTFVEDMHEGALTLNKEGLILYCNKRFAELVKEPADHVIGSYFKHFLTPVDGQGLDNLLAQLSKTKNDSMTVSLINALYLKLSFRLGPPYFQGENYIVIATDVSELKKKENELIALHRLLEQHLDQSRGLRIDLVNAKLEATTENNKLMKANKKLVNEIARLKLGKRPRGTLDEQSAKNK